MNGATSWAHRFSADGGSLFYPHHLPLNGLPEPPHRRSSPLVA